MQELYFLGCCPPPTPPVDSELNQPTLQIRMKKMVSLQMMFSNEKEGKNFPGEMQNMIAKDTRIFCSSSLTF